MPRLPDVQSFGARPQLQGRGVPSSEGATGGLMRAAEISGRSAQAGAEQTSQIGEGFSRIGQVLMDAEDRSQKRIEAVNRARAVSQLSQEGQEELRNLLTTSDISDAGVFSNYIQSVDAKHRKLLQEFGGRPESQAALAANLMGIRDSLVDSARSAHFKAATDLVDATFANTLRELNSVVASNPMQLDAAMAAGTARIKMLSDALTPEQETAYQQQLSETLQYARVKTMIDRGQVNEAEHVLLQDPGAVQSIGPAAQNELSDRIARIRSDEASIDRELKIAEGKARIEAKYRAPAQQPEVIRVADALGYKQGSPEFEEFVLGVMEGSKPGGARNAEIADIMETFGIDRGTALKVQGGLVKMSTPDQSGNITLIDTVTLKPVGSFNPEAERTQEAATEMAGAPPQTPKAGEPIEETAKKATGIGPGITRTIDALVGSLGIIGETIGPETAKAKSKIQLFNKTAKRALIDNTKFPVTEQQEIASLLPSTTWFQNPETAALQASELRDYLIGLRGEKVKSLSGKTISSERRGDLNDQINSIDEVLRLMGAAPEDSETLPEAGDVVDGYRFKGGDPSKQESWEKQ